MKSISLIRQLAAAFFLPLMMCNPCLADPQVYAPTAPVAFDQVPGRQIFFTVGKPGIPGPENEGHTSNAGFVITSEGVVVFDALGTPSLGWALLQQIRSVTDKPIRYVVVSHYHADHIYGLQALKDHTNALIVAEDRAAEYKENELTVDERAGQRLSQRRAALSPWVNENTRIVAPDWTFKERATINLGGERFILLSGAPAHSSNDAMMLVESAGVLFTGDIVQNGRIPFMNSDDVSTANWLRALEEVERLNPVYIIPGHGRPSTNAKEALTFTRDYIQHVRAQMLGAVESWVDFEAAYSQADWTRYKAFPAFANNNRGNAYRVFLELEQAQIKGQR